MATPPNFLAYVVEDRGEGVKANWREVAAVWSHRNDNGFDLIIPAGISLSGRIVIMERKDKPDRPADEQPRQRRDRGEEPAGRR